MKNKLTPEQEALLNKFKSAEKKTGQKLL